MPTFRTFVELQKDLEGKVKIALDNVGDRVWQELYDFINREIYVNNTLKLDTSGGYERTYQFLDSLRKTSSVRGGSKFTYVIDFDIDKMNSEWRDDHLFNAHMSISSDTNWNGSSIASWMPQFMDTGINSKYYSHTGVRFMDFIKEFLIQNFNRLIKIELSKFGISVK